MPQAKPYSISRVLNAPLALVYQVHTDPAHLAQWMSPAGFKVIKADQDFRPGGRYHYGLEAPDGSQMWGKQIFKEIVPQSKLVYLQSFSDKDGSVSRHPLSPTWPLQMLATTTFKDLGGGKTEVTISWQPYEATDEENATFDAARGGMDQGFAGTFANLETYLGSLEKA